MPSAPSDLEEQTRRLVSLRRGHPAWLLLAATRGPLMLAVLRRLFDSQPAGVDLEEAAAHLAAAFERHADDTQLEIGDDPARLARREIREWIKRKLIVERDGVLLATDALQRCLVFLESLDDQTMTSTASRLATVQRVIESLHARLSSDPSTRAEVLRQRIDKLTEELREVEGGRFEVLSEARAAEEIREVYQLAASLRADFRRVEDSFRAADRALRERILNRQSDRGQIVDELLDSHDALLETGEGQVFDGFYQQLIQTSELELMKLQLRAILESEHADRALQRSQRADLRALVPRLLEESQRVIQARSQSERDVRVFLKTALADEHLRAGALVQEILRVAVSVDWQSQKVRRAASPLPPVAIGIANLPLVQRLLVKQVGGEPNQELDLSVHADDLSQMDQEFWEAYRALDRRQLFDETLEGLRAAGRPLTIGELARAVPPTHDLETLAYWLAMAREAGVELGPAEESVELADDDRFRRFFVPAAELDAAAVGRLTADRLE